MKGLFQLASNDFTKGLIVAVLAAVFTFLLGALNAPGFDFATFDWAEFIRVAIVALVGYLSKNLLTTNKGNFLGSIPVDKPEK